MCGKKRHTKTEIRSEMSDLICGRIAAGEKYNLTHDKGGIQIILRINLQEGIEQTIVDTLKKIPAALRHLVKISIGNVVAPLSA